MKRTALVLLIAPSFALSVSGCDLGETPLETEASGTPFADAPTFTVQAAGKVVTVQPNGVNDTEALRVAIDECIASGPGCTIQLVEGTYYSAGLNAAGFDGALIGAGPGLSIIKYKKLPGIVEGYGSEGCALSANGEHSWLHFEGGDVSVSGISLRVEDPEPCEVHPHPWWPWTDPNTAMEFGVAQDGGSLSVTSAAITGTSTGDGCRFWSGEAFPYNMCQGIQTFQTKLLVDHSVVLGSLTPVAPFESEAVVTDNELEAGVFGVSCNAGQCEVTGNRITVAESGYYGIYASLAELVARNNEITVRSEYADGIGLWAASLSSVTGNDIVLAANESRYGGIFVAGSENTTVAGNHISGSKYSYLIQDYWSTGTVLRGNVLENVAGQLGIHLLFSENCKLLNNVFTDSGPGEIPSILIDDATGCTIVQPRQLIAVSGAGINHVVAWDCYLIGNPTDIDVGVDSRKQVCRATPEGAPFAAKTMGEATFDLGARLAQASAREEMIQEMMQAIPW